MPSPSSRAPSSVQGRSQGVLDLAFLLGVLAKTVDGLIELGGGVVLLWLSPQQLVSGVRGLTAEELREDPHDVVAHLILHGVAHLDATTTTFVAVYLLVHGVVKLAIIAALVWGTLKVYPWALAALTAFLAFQVYELIVHPTAGVALLVVLDALIVWLTYREWRQGHTLRETYGRTREWLGRR